MQTIKRLLLIVGCGGVIASAGAAQPNLLQNGSFENGAFADNVQHINDLVPGSTDITGWTSGNYTISWLRNDNPFTLTTPSGNFFLDMTGPGDSDFGFIQQTFATVTGQKYHLSFDMGANNNCPGFDCTGPMAMKVNVAGTEQTFAGFDPVGLGMHWGTFEMDFAATGASTTLSLEALGVTGASRQFRGLDNVAVIAVPEPQSYVMLLAGLGVLGLAVRRRRRTF